MILNMLMNLVMNTGWQESYSMFGDIDNGETLMLKIIVKKEGMYYEKRNCII